MPELPPEILLKIFSYFPCEADRAQDVSTLTQLCLVSKSFLDAARDVLYRRLDILILTAQPDNPATPLTRILLQPKEGQSSPLLAIGPCSPINSVTDYPHLARRLRSISIFFTTHDSRLPTPDFTALKESHGTTLLKRAMRTLLDDIWKSCPPRTELRWSNAPDWAITALIESLEGHSNMIRTLGFGIWEGDTYPSTPELFVELCGQTKELEELVFGGLNMDYRAERGRWIGNKKPRFALQALNINYASLEGFGFLSSCSHSSLTTLELTLSTPHASDTIDLSPFPNLTSVKLALFSSRRAVNYHEKPPRLAWFAPSPSRISYARLGPLGMEDPLPLIPSSITQLQLNISRSRTEKPQEEEEEDPFAYFRRRPPPSAKPSSPLIRDLLKLLATRPTLPRKLTVKWVGFERDLGHPVEEEERPKLREACGRSGVLLRFESSIVQIIHPVLESF